MKKTIARLIDTELNIVPSVVVEPKHAYNDQLGWYFPVKCCEGDNKPEPYWVILPYSFYDESGVCQNPYYRGELKWTLSEPLLRKYMWVTPRQERDEYPQRDEVLHTLVSDHYMKTMKWDEETPHSLSDKASKLYYRYNFNEMDRTMLGNRTGTTNMTGMYGVLKMFKIGLMCNNTQRDGSAFFQFSLWDLWLAFTNEILVHEEFGEYRQAWNWFFLKYLYICKQEKGKAQYRSELFVHYDRETGRQYSILDEKNNFIEPPIHIRDKAKKRKAVRDWFVKQSYV